MAQPAYRLSTKLTQLPLIVGSAHTMNSGQITGSGDGKFEVPVTLLREPPARFPASPVRRSGKFAASGSLDPFEVLRDSVLRKNELIVPFPHDRSFLRNVELRVDVWH